jgi:hypothetical protein
MSLHDFLVYLERVVYFQSPVKFSIRIRENRQAIAGSKQRNFRIIALNN